MKTDNTTGDAIVVVAGQAARRTGSTAFLSPAPQAFPE